MLEYIYYSIYATCSFSFVYHHKKFSSNPVLLYFHTTNYPRSMSYRFSIFILAWFLLYACNSGQKSDVKRHTTINMVTSFNNLFLDSPKLQQFLHANIQFKNYEKQFEDFYKERNYEYAWFDSSGPGEQANNFINLLNNTISNLQDSSLYNRQLYGLYKSFTNNGIKHKQDEVLNTELFLTGQFFNYAARMYKGTDSDVVALGWFIPRKKVNLTALLDSVIVTKNKQPDEFAPLNEQYKKLQAFIPVYFQLQKTNWDSIAKPLKSLHIGDRNKIILTVKERLSKLDDFAVNDSSSVYDTALSRSVKAFQKRMGLGVDGVIGTKMIDELNITPAQRIQQIFVNLERIRWMPSENESRRIFVNIPEYKMYVYDSGRLNFTMNVIVGTAANSTVIFSGNLKYIVFSPYWKVPVKIVREEILPALKKDTAYLTRNNMERIGGRDTLPSIRQKPGPGNSLGKVKFLFPNNYDIYFHDTPNRDLFSASSRSFSHGCIRVGEPKHLAEFLLQGDTTWNSIRMDTAMNSKKETWVALQKSVPVVIGYFTAWVDKNGELNFRKDIYGHDAKLADKLFVKQ
ncbi:MAG TPA: L,D-transpeptidase family protein [Chitinophagaceae bacterium]|nr:L,D-transpeptidase family protein [Chitinophagaceae bacterium]